MVGLQVWLLQILDHAMIHFTCPSRNHLPCKTAFASEDIMMILMLLTPSKHGTTYWLVHQLIEVGSTAGLRPHTCCNCLNAAHKEVT